jgi:hypothetical protein
MAKLSTPITRLFSLAMPTVPDAVFFGEAFNLVTAGYVPAAMMPHLFFGSLPNSFVG